MNQSAAKDTPHQTDKAIPPASASRRSFLIAVIAFFATIAVAPTSSRAENVSKALPVYTVFIDPPTCFVFVKLPAGWKFVGKVEPRDLAQLPSGVVTALLAGEEESGESNRMAQQRSTNRAEP